jgi:hypothetical protein
VSDQWSAHPGDAPPSTAGLPPGWGNGAGAPLTEPPTYGSGPPLPPLPGPRPPSGDRNLVIAVSSLAVVLLLVVAVLVFLGRRDSTVAAGPGTTTSTKVSSTTTTAGNGQAPTTDRGGDPSTTSVTPTQPISPPVTRSGGVPPTIEQVDAAVAEISKFVEKERALTFTGPVEIDLVTDTIFAAKLKAKLDARKDDRVKMGRILAALGLVESRLDYEGTVATLQSIGVVAYYDPDDNVLVIRAVQLTPYLRASLARELTRALDDQHFELHRPQYEPEQDEIAAGFDAVVEGDAHRVEDAFVAAMSSPDQDQRKREENQFVADNPAPNVPAIVFEVIRSPVELGVPFVRKLVEQGGVEELGTAFKDPPRISAQLLHTDRWFAHDERVDVDKPKADGEQFAEGVFGEELTRLLLANDADEDAADKAAAGWAGDWYVAWDDGRGGSCIRIDFRMLTPTDLKELETALTEWAQAHGGRAQVDANEEHDTIELTSCSSVSGGGHSPA